MNCSHGGTSPLTMSFPAFPSQWRMSMLSKYIAAAMLGTALMAVPAISQAQSPSTSSPAPAAKSDSTPAAAVNPAFKDKWRASKLIGLDIYNDQDEKLGDINELLLDKGGKIAAVVIGVGGFLGMGEHDIAVSMDKLKFVEEPLRTSSTAPATTRDTTTRDTTTGTANPPASTTTTTTTTAPARSAH